VAEVGTAISPATVPKARPTDHREQRERVEAALTNGLSNARLEQINTQIRLITRRGFDYDSPLTTHHRPSSH
jgi:transposase